ncbi:hypothetical protein AQF98_21225 [Pedobacter sp. Hv1]|nr:hypothetical protein AQF98_21225 [Pedobacter sp. Hv1]
MTIFYPSAAQIRPVLRPVSNQGNEIATLIQQKANQLNLGPVHAESAVMRPTAGAGGYFLRFEKGWVYYNPTLKQAFAVYGDIMKKWGELGYETGELGFPTSDEKDSDQSGWKRMNSFEKGTIYWADGRTTVEKKGIMDKIKVINNTMVTPKFVNKNVLSIKKMLGQNFDLVRMNSMTAENFTVKNGTKAIKATQNGAVKCITEYKTIDVRNPDQDVLSLAATENVAIGAVYQLSDFTNGKFNPIGENEQNRTPIRLSISQTTVNQLVDFPSVDNLMVARDAVLNKPVALANPKQTLKSNEVYSMQDLNLRASVGYFGPGIDVAAELKMNQNSKNHKYLLEVNRESFIMTARPTITGKFFTDDALNKKDDLIYVDKITYGAKLLVYFEDASDLSDIETDVSGEYGTASAKFNSKYKQALQNTNFSIFAYGLPANVNAINSVKGYDAMMNEVNRLLRSFDGQNKSANKFGSPISYSLKFLNGDVAVCSGQMENLPQTTCSQENYKWRVELVGLYCNKTDDNSNDDINGWARFEAFDGNNNPLNDRSNRSGNLPFKSTRFRGPGTGFSMGQLEQIYDFNVGDDNAYIQIKSRIWDQEDIKKNDYSSSGDNTADTRKFYLRDIKLKAPSPEQVGTMKGVRALELKPGYGNYTLLVNIYPVVD